MRQLEIQYFWPLTEQISLDLDFTDSEKPKFWTAGASSGTFLISNGHGDTNWSTSTIEPSLTIDVDSCPITIRSKEKPNFIKRYIYKVLGVKWKVK